jgi:hypothetical protein
VIKVRCDFHRQIRKTRHNDFDHSDPRASPSEECENLQLQWSLRGVSHRHRLCSGTVCIVVMTCAPGLLPALVRTLRVRGFRTCRRRRWRRPYQSSQQIGQNINSLSPHASPAVDSFPGTGTRWRRSRRLGNVEEAEMTHV